MKIYNTFTRKKEEFVPVTAGQVGIYVCGPTVYGMPHLGHAKSYINFDTVIRYFKYLGYKVKYVQNITDVGHLVGDGDDGEDKISKQAKKEKLDPYEIAYKYEVLYFENMDKLNVLRPSISCRATGFIIDMIEAIKEIIDKGYAYVTDKGNVYFDVRKYKSYGQLSNRTIDKTLSGERIEVADDKRNPEDFALWKSVDENTLMQWPSPWGQGCPGWHIECTVLSKKFLGKHFDIHGGGIDNLFPHHECECAQADIVNGCIPMNFFMHNNLVTVNGVKMGKSLGNFITLPDLFKKYSPMAVRYYINQFHYRSPVDFNDEGLKLAQKQFDKTNELVAKLRAIVDKQSNIVDEDLVAIKNNFESAMNDDFNTPVAMAEFIKLIKLLQSELKNNNTNRLEQINTLITKLGEEVLGYVFTQSGTSPIEDIPGDIKDLAQKRWNAKLAKDWAVADELRKEIEAKGYEIKDSKDNYQIIKK